MSRETAHLGNEAHHRNEYLAAGGDDFSISREKVLSCEKVARGVSTTEDTESTEKEMIEIICPIPGRMKNGLGKLQWHELTRLIFTRSVYGEE